MGSLGIPLEDSCFRAPSIASYRQWEEKGLLDSQEDLPHYAQSRQLNQKRLVEVSQPALHENVEERGRNAYGMKSVVRPRVGGPRGRQLGSSRRARARARRGPAEHSFLMRRGVGLAGLRQQQQLENQKKDVGEEMQKVRQEHIATMLAEFKENLSDFSSKYRSQISKDPVFRHAFTEMTSKLGVDPLASSKGFWWQLGLGDFYSELGVQIVDVCIRTRVRNGGIISLSNLLMELDKMRSRGSASEGTSAATAAAGGSRASASLR